MRATRASDEVGRLEEAVSRMEKDRKHNEILIMQVFPQMLFFNLPID